MVREKPPSPRNFLQSPDGSHDPDGCGQAVCAAREFANLEEENAKLFTLLLKDAGPPV